MTAPKTGDRFTINGITFVVTSSQTHTFAEGSTYNLVGCTGKGEIAYVSIKAPNANAG